MLSALWLKILASVLMLSDHLGIALYVSGRITRDAYIVFRCVGRCAFPIYCFLLCEGAKYTRNRFRYALQLLLFGLVSELPFNLLSQRSLWSVEAQNVFFTLFLGLLLLFLLEYVDKRRGKARKWWIILFLAAMLSAAVLADVLELDYGFGGILIIVIMGLNNLGLSKLRAYFADDRFIRLLTAAIGIVALSMCHTNIEYYALFSLLPIGLYNGTRGLKSGALKYGFYLFYPVHLFLLWEFFMRGISG